MPENLYYSIEFRKSANRQLTFDDKCEVALEATNTVESLVFFVTTPERYSLENIDEDSLQNYLNSTRNLINNFLSVVRENLYEINEQLIKLEKTVQKTEVKTKN